MLHSLSTVDVVGLGASSVDHVHVVPALPAAGGLNDKVRIASRFTSCGGQVATMIAACATFGLRARYLGPLGNDANTRVIRYELARRGVDLSGAILREAENQYAVIVVDEQTGERVVLWSRDPALTPETAALSAGALTSGRVLHVDDVDEDTSIQAARIASAGGVIVTSDLDRVTDRTPELVASVTFPIFAAHVPAALTGEPDPERALRKLRRFHPGTLCVTLGARGAMALEGDRLVYAQSRPVTAVDTTASGDVFRAAFVFGLLAGHPIDRILRFANAAAGIACTRRGAIASIPALEEIPPS
jgi:sugar/nucleoside kinase (ribokinase family)